MTSSTSLIIDPFMPAMAPSPEAMAALRQDMCFADEDACFSCGGTDFGLVAARDRYGISLRYVMCRHCDLVFANPYYTDEALERFYTRHYANIYGRTLEPARMFEGERERGRAIARLVGKMARARGLSPASILDIRCSHGGVLACFPDHWRRVGYDYDETLFEHGRRAGLSLHRIDALSSETRRFDIVMMNQVVEHLRDPVAALKRAATFLADDGILYVEVPGLRSPHVRHIDVRLFFKNAHRFLFTADTLTRCAHRAGLQALSVNETVEAFFRQPNPVERREIPPPRASGGAAAFVRARAGEPGWLRKLHLAIYRARRLTAGRLYRALRRRLSRSL